MSSSCVCQWWALLYSVWLLCYSEKNSQKSSLFRSVLLEIQLEKKNKKKKPTIWLFCVVNHHTESTQKPLRWYTKEVTSIISTWERRAGRDGKEKTAMGAECRAQPPETPVRHMTRRHKATCQVPPTIFRWAPSKKTEWTPTCSSTG